MPSLKTTVPGGHHVPPTSQGCPLAIVIHQALFVISLQMVSIHFRVYASSWFQVNQDLILIFNISSEAQMLTQFSLIKTAYYVLETMLGVGKSKTKACFWY